MIQMEQFACLCKRHVRMPGSAQRDPPSHFPCDCNPNSFGSPLSCPRLWAVRRSHSLRRTLPLRFSHLSQLDRPRTVAFYIVNTVRSAYAPNQSTQSILQSSYSSTEPLPTPHIQ